MLEIRLLKRHEFDEAVAVWNACFQNSQAPEHSHQSNAIVYVAEVDGKIVGTVSLTVTSRFSYIDNLSVLPEHRNQGIATKLVEAAMKIADLNSEETYAVCVSQWSARICKKLGFKKEDQGRYVKKSLQKFPNRCIL